MEDLADATRFKEAHADLLAEVVELIQRNELAEAEAERLGKFNAEVRHPSTSVTKSFHDCPSDCGAYQSTTKDLLRRPYTTRTR